MCVLITRVLITRVRRVAGRRGAAMFGVGSLPLGGAGVGAQLLALVCAVCGEAGSCAGGACRIETRLQL